MMIAFSDVWIARDRNYIESRWNHLLNGWRSIVLLQQKSNSQDPFSGIIDRVAVEKT